MKLHLLVIVALCPVLVSGQGFFDYINPFYWIINWIVSLLIPQELTCGAVEAAFEAAVGLGDIVTCTCENNVNVIVFFPSGVTAKANCALNEGQNLDVGGKAVTAGKIEFDVTAGLAEVANGLSGEFKIDKLNACLTIDGTEICADYAGSIANGGFQITNCDIDIGSQDCACEICPDNASVKFDCQPAFPAITSAGQCVGPALFDD